VDKLLNITEKSNVVIHALAFIAAHPEMEMVSVKRIAEELQVSESYLAKVLQPIAKEGILDSTRGAKGGYCLNRNPREIYLIDLLKLLEGDLPPAHQCLFDRPACNLQACPFRNLSVKVKETVIRELDGYSILDVAKSFV
jgi:Rrf2 family protein